MITNFKFTNYSCFKEGSLDFSFNRNEIKNNRKTLRFFKKYGKKFNLVFAFYGANASGKTTFLNALFDYFLLATTQSSYNNYVYNPYKFSKDFREKNASFEVFFTHDKTEYKHYIEYDKNGVIYQVLHNLTTKQTISENSNDDLKFLIKSILPKIYMPCKRLYKISDNALKLFLQHIQMNFKDFDFIYKTTIYENEDADNDVKLDICHESRGLRKLTELATPFIFALKNGGMLLLDNIENSLHPLVVEFIVKCFKNKEINKKGAVLLFTTHNYDLVELLDAENIFVVDRDRYVSSVKPVDYNLLENDQHKKTLKKLTDFKQKFKWGYYGSRAGVSSLESFHWNFDDFIKRK